MAAFYSNGDCSIWSSVVRQRFYCGEQRGRLSFTVCCRLYINLYKSLTPVCLYCDPFNYFLMCFSLFWTKHSYIYSETVVTFPVRIFYTIDLWQFSHLAVL